MRQGWKKKTLAGVLATTLAVSLVPGTLLRAAEGPQMGTPYNTQGIYDVGVAHVLVNQVYGGSDDGAASHSFVELYNPCATEVDLSGWYLQYQASAEGEGHGWQSLELTGTIPAGGYYLVRCGAIDDPASADYQVPQGDQEWDLQLHNKGVSVALFSQEVALTEDFSGAVTDENRPVGYVDLLAVQGNDGEPQQEPPVYEGAFEDLQSKKKAVRRENFADTDNNSADAQAVDYSDPVDGAQGPHNSQMEQGGGDQEPTTPADTYRTGSFEQGAGLTLELLNSVGIGQADPDGGVAEIVAYNADRSQAYVVNGKDGLLYTLDLGTEGLTVAGSLDVRTLVEGFTYGDMTSVAVDSVNDHIAVALQSQDYAANGRVLLLNYNMELLASYEVGVQPDMVTFTPDGSKILTANEGEPREGYGNGAVDPEGSVTIIDLEDGTVTTAGFAAFDAQTLVQEGILIGKVDGQLNEAAADLEPEYIAVSADGSRAYVTLQEANAIATVDLESKEILSVKSLGFQDLSQGERAIDLVEDGAYLPKTYEDAVGVYMPDGIAAYEVNGITYLVTANEGDAREWGDYCNEIEETLTATDGTVAQEVRVLDQDLVAVPDSTKAYLYGGRSFSIYRADTMEQVYDSANDFEALTAQYLPDWFNCSNDDIDVDSRSPKKGPEAESVTLGQVGNKFYAFVALERIGGVMVYDVTDPAKVQFVNYINTRDFAGEVQGDVAPEGLAFLPANVTATGKPMLLAACEVSGTVAAYTMDGPATEIPTPEEPDDDPLPGGGGDGGQGTGSGVPQNPNTADGFGLWAGLTALAGSLAGMGLFARRKRRAK